MDEDCDFSEDFGKDFQNNIYVYIPQHSEVLCDLTKL